MKDTAAATATAVSAQASDLASSVGAELAEVAEIGKERGAEALRGMAQTVQGVAREIGTQSPKVASYVRGAARKVENFSEAVSDQSVGDLMGAATKMARQRPVAVAAGAGAVAAAGLALTRVMKKDKVAKAAKSALAKTGKPAKRQAASVRRAVSKPAIRAGGNRRGKGK